MKPVETRGVSIIFRQLLPFQSQKDQLMPQCALNLGLGQEYNKCDSSFPLMLPSDPSPTRYGKGFYWSVTCNP